MSSNKNTAGGHKTKRSLPRLTPPKTDLRRTKTKDIVAAEKTQDIYTIVFGAKSRTLNKIHVRHIIKKVAEFHTAGELNNEDRIVLFKELYRKTKDEDQRKLIKQHYRLFEANFQKIAKKASEIKKIEVNAGIPELSSRNSPFRMDMTDMSDQPDSTRESTSPRTPESPPSPSRPQLYRSQTTLPAKKFSFTASRVPQPRIFRRRFTSSLNQHTSASSDVSKTPPSRKEEDHYQSLAELSISRVENDLVKNIQDLVRLTVLEMQRRGSL